VQCVESVRPNLFDRPSASAWLVSQNTRCSGLSEPGEPNSSSARLLCGRNRTSTAPEAGSNCFSTSAEAPVEEPLDDRPRPIGCFGPKEPGKPFSLRCAASSRPKPRLNCARCGVLLRRPGETEQRESGCVPSVTSRKREIRLGDVAEPPTSILPWAYDPLLQRPRSQRSPPPHASVVCRPSRPERTDCSVQQAVEPHRSCDLHSKLHAPRRGGKAPHVSVSS
jgi:hypothetical protein